MGFDWKERRRELDELRTASDSGQLATYDLLVIGGGITGTAIARDAALRGCRVLLVEKGDFADGTSSRSSKLVHGGVRYLEHGEFGLVAESTRERARLWKQAPELVRPLPFLFPAFEDSRVPLWKLDAGLWLYDILAAFRTPSLHRKYSAKETRNQEPLLEKSGLTGSILYWDGATSDALLTLATMLDARALGARCLPRVAFRGVEWSGAGEHHVVELQDQVGGGDAPTFRVRARAVVAATGPWIDGLGLLHRKSRLLATTRGSHIVVPGDKLPLRHAVVLIHPRDQRVLFAIPWGECSVLGTTDIFDQGSPDRVAISSDEVDYLIAAGNDFFPRAKLERGDVRSAWSGLRPLLAPPDDASASEISRDHHIEWKEPGLLVIAGGKLTTHREMAEQALDRIAIETKAWRKPLARVFESGLTRKRELPRLGTLAPHACAGPLEAKNSVGRPRFGRSEATMLDDATLRKICREQIVLTLEDFFVRRTDIFYKEPGNGLELLEKLKPLLREELGWDDDEWSRQVETYRAYVHQQVGRALNRA